MSRKLTPSHNACSWKARWVMRRNRILGSQAFQDWAARTPIFRTIARRKAARQFNLIAGFVYSQIIYLFVQSGLIIHLRSGLYSEEEIGNFANMERDSVARLLRAGAALDIVESPQDSYWTLGQTGAALSANEGAMAMIRHHQLFYSDMADPLKLLSQEGSCESALASFWTYAAKEPGNHADADDSIGYSQLMAATQPMVWRQILSRYDFAGHRKMLDIGGGSGAFVEAIGQAAPALALAIFDLPGVVPSANARFKGTPLADRVTVHSGSFKQDGLPVGYDLITLVRILHDHDDDVARALLTKIHAALPAGGRLLLVEPMADTKGARAMGDAYFGFYLKAMGSGRPRSLSENRLMLEKAGFSSSKPIKTDLPIIAKAIVANR